MLPGDVAQRLPAGNGRILTATSVPIGAKRRRRRGQERQQREPAKRTPKRYQNTTISQGIVCPVRNTTGGFSDGFTAVFSLKIAPKHYTKTHCPPIPAVTAETGGLLLKEALCQECQKS